MKHQIKGMALILFGILIGLGGGIAWYIGLICGIIGLGMVLLD